MKGKKTVALLALTISSSSFALRMQPIETKTVCLSSYELSDGSQRMGNCDESENNASLNKPVGENGCAENQVALTASKWRADQEFSPAIYSCLPHNITQL